MLVFINLLFSDEIFRQSIGAYEDNSNRFLRLEEHKENYVLFYQSLPPGIYAPNLNKEIKAQLSIKVPLWKEAIFENGTLYFTYTQTIWFQFLNFAFSNPIRDSNYNPEIFYNYYFNADFLGGKFKYIRLGVNHLSNGVGGTKCFREKEQQTPEDFNMLCQSRSAGNRVILSINQEWLDRFGLILSVWPYVPKRRDNPDLAEYMGYGNLHLYYEDKRNIVELNISPIFTNYSNYKGSIKLGYTFKITKHYGLYLQYFYGYGDSLYEYNIKSQRIGVGIRM